MVPGCGGSTLTTTSFAVIISVADPCAGKQPIISQQPAGQSGSTAMFSVAATSPPGAGSLTYQWRKNGANLINGPTGTGATISGATTPTLTISSATSAECGAVFDCIVSNSCGSVRSEAAGLCIGGGCRGDFNNDGLFDAADVQPFVNALVAGAVCP